ncbi:MAG: hypothetical protein QOD66_22 [Solirubrobacteraceae bacterium]|jgi:hypothetical protein|nr:hypothetical protein [Solirubrobacteraceae bacterium]
MTAASLRTVLRRVGSISRWMLVAAILSGVAGSSVARADDWFPHYTGSHWTYFWTDSKYNQRGTTEQVSVTTQTGPNGCGWQASWTGDTLIPLTSGSSSSSSTTPVIDQPDNGTMCFQDQGYGLENTDYSGTPPPINEPSLCANGGTSGGCASSLGSTLFDVIWGSRNPVISEPLLQGTTWNGTGGGDGSVTSANRYFGMQLVKVPAFPHGIMAAAVQSEIVLAGTNGDDYGSGTRTTWWVRGLGPVKMVFDHVDGSVTTSELQATNLHPSFVQQPDADYFPLRVGAHGTYEWTNRKHLKQPEVDKVSVDAASNRTGRVTVRSVSGPIHAVGEYLFSLRLDGLRTTLARTSGATLLHLPRLGHGRHFFNPLDLMIYGFNPILPGYGAPGTFWHSGNAYDLKQFGVTGNTSVVGIRRVHVPAGTFQALELRSTLRQPGYAYGSGVRLMWFAPGRGLVKLVFSHRDRSTSVVQLIK